tara:strand:- start:148 stop:1344 length:1197 start_codon:yes stop_codon:yes gene_type:complete
VATKIYKVEEARRLARARLPRMMFDYIEGGSGDERLCSTNIAAFDRIELMPRVLTNVAKRDLSCQILGIDAGLPFGIAPMGMCAISTPGADQILAREAALRRIPLGVSTASSATLESVIKQSDGYAWFQLYADPAVEFVDELVGRAEASGYTVLVLTVDVPIPSFRIRDLSNGFGFPMTWGPRQLFDLACHPRWSLSTLAHSLSHGTPKPMNYATSSQGASFVRGSSRARADWDFLHRLRDRWPHKLVVKGVQAPEDARRIKAAGADAIYVSNHGARQLNAAPPSIESVAPVRAAIGDDMPLIVDGGVRSGEHVIKAIASGADFVMIGRSAMFGLGARGAEGLSDIIDSFAREASSVIGLVGKTRMDDIDATCLAEAHEHWPADYRTKGMKGGDETDG